MLEPEQGKRYRFIYRVPGVHRKNRWMIADFLGVANADLDFPYWVFSGRPVFGTTECRKDWIISIEEVPKTTEPGHN